MLIIEKRGNMDQLVIIQCFVTVVMLIQDALSMCPKCKNDDMHSIKLVCQQKGQQLDEAELTKNETIVCSSLDELLTCVAEKVPQCLSTFGSETQRYRWTPWDCHLSPNQVYKYQEIISSGCNTNDKHSVRTVPDRDRSPDIAMDELKSSNLSINDTNSSTKSECGFFLPIGLLCLQLIKLWTLHGLP